MGFFNTGVDEVNKVGMLNITGNIRPAIWNKTIVNEKGKPQRLAMDILADIVYWYRPTEIRDEASGQVIGWKKRFKADMLQRSYAELADEFGEDRKTIARNLVFLEELGVIKRVFRTLKFKNGTVLNNVMFLHLNPERLYELTYPDEMEDILKTNVESNSNEDYIIISEDSGGTNENTSNNANFTPMDKNDQRVWTDLTRGYGQNCPEGIDGFDQRVSSDMSRGIDKNVQTNTKNTTKITGENTFTSYPISENVDNLEINLEEKIEYNLLVEYRSLIRENEGIPLEFAFEPAKMKMAILSLSNFHDRAWKIEDRGYKTTEDIVFEAMVKNLLEMATNREMTIIGGTNKVSYKHINDKLKRIYKKDENLKSFLDRCIDRYVEASKTTTIQKIDQYCKAILWNTMKIFELDWESYFNRTYHNSLINNGG